MNKQKLTPVQMQKKLNEIILYIDECGDVADLAFEAAKRIPKGNPEDTLPRRKNEIKRIIEDMNTLGVSKIEPDELSYLIDIHDAVANQEISALKEFMSISEKIKTVAPELTVVINEVIKAAKERINRRR